MSSNQVTFAGGEAEAHVISKDGKALPKDAQVISSIMKDMGHTDYDPKVVNQLMEFLYRYVTSVVEDAKLVSSHSKKKVVEIYFWFETLSVYDNIVHTSTPNCSRPTPTSLT